MTSSVVPAPPTTFPTFPSKPFTIAAGTKLHRNHSPAFGPAAFNPGKGDISRFAPIADGAGNIVTSLYAATSREAAAFETVFHDIDPRASFKTVRQQTVELRMLSIIAPTKDLVLYPLFAPDLKALGLARTDLIETPKATYLQTALWAQALHGAHPGIHGLAWTSRQCDPEVCVILFGDRVSQADFESVESLRVDGNGILFNEMRSFAARAGIVITV